MTQKINGSGRRVLTFPAVHPCESISPSTLLNSLIDLAHDICAYKSEFFTSNKRNAHETIRQVQNLLIFLEEIRVGLVDVPDSLVISFSELHLAFQRIQYLLEDCTREGARLWVLMKSERVANQFRVLIRAIGTGLDVLPLEAVDVCISSDVKELVELVMRQARNAIFEIDPDDKRVLNGVIRILDRFEEGVDPDKSEVKRVLDYLGIQKWSQCNKEVKFLDSEIGIEYLNVDKRRELTLLSSLMGFSSYCRCVMFDLVDNEASQQVNSKCCNNMLGGLAPDDFRCPISLEIMKDPVTLSTGHTYDRASILKWFRAGNATCPKTGERLQSKELVPNLALKIIIQDWSVDNGVSITEKSSHKNRDITRTVLAGSLAAEGAVKLLANFLANRLVDGTSEEKNKAAYEIRLLTKTSIFNRSCLVEVGSIPSLLHLLVSKDSLTQENAIAALLNLSKHCKSKSIIVENGGLELIVDLLKKGLKVETRHHAAATLFYIASIEEYRKLIGENPEAIPALVDMVRDGTDRGKKNALVAIFGLLMHSGNHWRVLAAGAIPLLLDLLNSSDREELITDSLAVLATLAEKIDGTIAILRRGALNMIMKFLDSCTSRTGKEYCVSLLLALCINGGANVVALLVKTPSLMGSLYSLLSESTSRGSKKASALIRILHEFYERSSSGSTTPVLPQDHSVDVW